MTPQVGQSTLVRSHGSTLSITCKVGQTISMSMSCTMFSVLCLSEQYNDIAWQRHYLAPLVSDIFLNKGPQTGKWNYIYNLPHSQFVREHFRKPHSAFCSSPTTRYALLTSAVCFEITWIRRSVCKLCISQSKLLHKCQLGNTWPGKMTEDQLG